MREFPGGDAAIAVRHDSGGSYMVTVTERSSTTHHTVKVWPSDIARYAPDSSPEELVEAAFKFLLNREPKEAILRKFDLAVIEQYFPSFPREVAHFLNA